VPSHPRNVSVHEVTSSTIKISWLEPEKPNGPNLIYRIYYTSLNQTHLAMPKNDPENGMRSEAGIHYYTLKKLSELIDLEVNCASLNLRFFQDLSPNTKSSSSPSRQDTTATLLHRSSNELMSLHHRSRSSRISPARRTEQSCCDGSDR